MPTFQVTGPDGTKYPVNAPEGATKEQAFEFFKREWTAGRVKKPETKPAEKPAETYPSGVPKQGGPWIDALKGVLGAAGDVAGKAGTALLERGKRDVGAVAELGKDVVTSLPRGMVNFGTRSQTTQQEMLGIRPEELAPHQRPGATSEALDKVLPPRTGSVGEMLGEALGDPGSYMGGLRGGGRPGIAPGVAPSPMNPMPKPPPVPPPAPPPPEVGRLPEGFFARSGAAKETLPEKRLPVQAAAKRAIEKVVEQPAQAASGATRAMPAEAEAAPPAHEALANAIGAFVDQHKVRLGGLAGAHIGAHALGSIVPGVGHVAGAFGGRAIGRAAVRELGEVEAELGKAASKAWERFQGQRLAKQPKSTTETSYNPTTSKGGAKTRGKATQVWAPGNTVDVGITKDLLIAERNADGSFTLLGKPDKNGISQSYNMRPHQGLVKEARVKFTDKMPSGKGSAAPMYEGDQ